MLYYFYLLIFVYNYLTFDLNMSLESYPWAGREVPYTLDETLGSEMQTVIN